MCLSEYQKCIFEYVGEYIKHNDIKPIFKTNAEVRKHITDFLNNFNGYSWEEEDEDTDTVPEDVKLYFLRKFVMEMGYYDNKTYINIAKECMRKHTWIDTNVAEYFPEKDIVISDDLLDMKVVDVDKPEQPQYNPNLFIYSF